MAGSRASSISGSPTPTATSATGTWWRAACGPGASGGRARSGDFGTIGRAHYVLSREGFSSGELAAGAEHGRRRSRGSSAPASGGAGAAGAGHRALRGGSRSPTAGGASTRFQRGDFELALGQLTRAREIGETLGDRRLEGYADFLSGWFRTTRGEWEAGIRDCTRSLERSPDPLSRSLSLCILGFAHREKGDIDRAIEFIGRAIEEQTAFSYTRNTGMLQVWISEAHLSAGRIEEARRDLRHALDAGEQMGTRLVQAAARRALGRIALSTDDLAQAGECFADALARFDAMGARFEVGLTHLLLAELGGRRGDGRRRRGTSTRRSRSSRLWTRPCTSSGRSPSERRWRRVPPAPRTEAPSRRTPLGRGGCRSSVLRVVRRRARRTHARAGRSSDAASGARWRE